MSFRLYEIEGGESGKGTTFKAALNNALVSAAEQSRLTESHLTLGRHNLSRAELTQQVNIYVRSEHEAVMAEVFPCKVLKTLGETALKGNELRLTTIPPPDFVDNPLPFVEPIFTTQTDSSLLKIQLFLAIIYLPD